MITPNSNTDLAAMSHAVYDVLNDINGHLTRKVRSKPMQGLGKGLKASNTPPGSVPHKVNGIMFGRECRPFHLWTIVSYSRNSRTRHAA
ncbi:hypothetical protein AVEN_37052-1 [Araneus ventricosus]|uniref:Uncharacterized protein n=1 Tax=Araneus ventricosus TaxID=182803 RepID=A0A4Y2RD17_ARAVE|nr:hypothetical protein AVEN_37052-1 [Araneus ventricosus]